MSSELRTYKEKKAAEEPGSSVGSYDPDNGGSGGVAEMEKVHGTEPASETSVSSAMNIAVLEDADAYPQLFDGGEYRYKGTGLSPQVATRLLMALCSPRVMLTRQVLTEMCTDFHEKNGGLKPGVGTSWMNNALEYLLNWDFCEQLEASGFYQLKDKERFFEVMALYDEGKFNESQERLQQHMKKLKKMRKESGGGDSVAEKTGGPWNCHDGLVSETEYGRRYKYRGIVLVPRVLMDVIMGTTVENKWLRRGQILDDAIKFHLANGGGSLDSSRSKDGLKQMAFGNLIAMEYAVKGKRKDGAPGNTGWYKVMGGADYWSKKADGTLQVKTVQSKPKAMPGPKTRKISKISTGKAGRAMSKAKKSAVKVESKKPEPAVLRGTKYKVRGLNLVESGGRDEMIITLRFFDELKSKDEAPENYVAVEVLEEDMLDIRVLNPNNFKINGKRPYLGQVVEMAMLGAGS